MLKVGHEWAIQWRGSIQSSAEIQQKGRIHFFFTIIILSIIVMITIITTAINPNS